MMTAVELDDLIVDLLPQVLADRELGNGRSFTPLHVRHLWALASLHTGVCVDEAELAAYVERHLPAEVRLVPLLANG